jgi:hypothetical protein
MTELEEQYNRNSVSIKKNDTVTDEIEKQKKKKRKYQKRQSLVLQQGTHVYKFTSVLSGVGILTGSVMFGFVIQRHVAIQQQCRKQLGVLADCAKPQYWYKNGFFLGTTTCAIEEYEIFDCGNGQLGDAVSLLDNSSMYSEMVKLKTIDVSGNSHLKSIPGSWSAIPQMLKRGHIKGTKNNGTDNKRRGLVVLANKNPALAKVPWSLCKDGSDIDLSVSSTMFSEHVDFSGQLLGLFYVSPIQSKQRVDHGTGSYCTPSSPCKICGYDCDDDNDCEGDLICVQREKGKFLKAHHLIVGCDFDSEGPFKISASSDYCSRYINSPESSFKLSKSCIFSIKNAKTLDLSNNGMTCPEKYNVDLLPDPIQYGNQQVVIPPRESIQYFSPQALILTSKSYEYCSFHPILQHLQKVSFLDLSNNSITSITSVLMSQTKFIIRNNASGGGVNLQNNPIQNLFIVSETVKDTMTWFDIIDTNPSIHKTLMTATIFAINLDDDDFREINLHNFEAMTDITVARTAISNLNVLDLPNQLVRLDLIDNEKITELQGTPFKNLKNLVSLRIMLGFAASLELFIHPRCSSQEGGLESIQPGVFKGLISLLFLRISCSRGVILEPDTFRGMPLLADLQLHTGIKKIKSGTFHGLENLLELQIMFNMESKFDNYKLNGRGSLTSLPAGAFDGLSNLRLLSLAYNDFKFDSIIPKAFSNMNPNGLHSMIICLPARTFNDSKRIFTTDQLKEVSHITKLNVTHDTINDTISTFSEEKIFYEGKCPKIFQSKLWTLIGGTPFCKSNIVDFFSSVDQEVQKDVLAKEKDQCGL